MRQLMELLKYGVTAAHVIDYMKSELVESNGYTELNLKDEFSLTELKPIPYLDENGNENAVDISGKQFSELEEELQDIISDAMITVKYFDNLDQYQKAEMFRRLNNGKPLSAKNRTLASAKNIKECALTARYISPSRT